MGLFAALFRRRPHERTGFELYGNAVAAARDPWFFGPEVGAPDTLNGRFDLVGLHAALLIRRLRADADPRGPALAQAVFDAMFADMDINLREMGVGDMVVGKRVKRMWEAFHGRARAYEAALDTADAGSLAAGLQRNVWREEPDAAGPREGATALAAYALANARQLAAAPFERFVAGEVRFDLPDRATMPGAPGLAGLPGQAGRP
jgi:cytochrome b pre-mRNA-processing protein 3